MARQGSQDGVKQTSLFGPSLVAVPQRTERPGEHELHVLITVKAAPNPSAKYGETVCVAGISVDHDWPGWVRLYPINFRYLTEDTQFQKYDIVSVRANPATADARAESWRPDMGSLVRLRHLRPWKPRREWLDPYVEGSMCDLNEGARHNTHARSLSLVQALDVASLKVEKHPGWTKTEQRKIDAYVRQLQLFNTRDTTTLRAPRFRGAYRWRCADRKCKGHEQGIIDWEFVALQRRLSRWSDAAAADALIQRFHHELCSSNKEVAFYVGNQAKRENVFSVLGVYYPPR
jgi:hypothetical protein